MNTIEELTQNQTTKTIWISVLDAMPRDGFYVVILDKHGNRHIGKFSSEKDGFVDNNEQPIDGPQYWSPTNYRTSCNPGTDEKTDANTNEPLRLQFSEKELQEAVKNWLDKNYGDQRRSNPDEYHRKLGILYDFVTDLFESK